MDGKGVNWSHPMNNSSQLPPKSPAGAYSMFGSGSSLFESDLLSSLPIRGNGSGGGGGHHKRTPSVGYLPNVQPTWLEEILESPDGEVVVRKGSHHRRSASDSVAFLDSPHDFSHFVEHVTQEEDDFILREPPPPIARPTHHRRGVSADFKSSQYDVPAPPRPSHRRGMSADYNNNRLDKEQLMSVLSELEPFQTHQPRQQQQQQQRSEKLLPRGGIGPPHPVRPGFSGESWNQEKGKKHVTLSVPSSTLSENVSHDRVRNQQKSSVSTPENRSTGSDSNSHSEDSNDEVSTGGRRKIEFEVQSRREGDASRQSQQADGTEVDPSLDPKKAKRILANRQSAQRSRVRKLQYISELERSVNALQTEVSTLSPQVGFYDHRRALLTAENALLKQKLAALSQSQRYKEAHNESLKKEVSRLLQIYNQQNHSQQQIQVVQHRPLSPNTYELAQQQFNKLDLGPNIPKPKSPDLFTSGGTSKNNSGGLSSSSLFAAGAGVLSSQMRSSSSSTVIRPPAAQSAKSGSCSGKSTLEGRMMGSSGALSSDFMVHNS